MWNQSPVQSFGLATKVDEMVLEYAAGLRNTLWLDR